MEALYDNYFDYTRPRAAVFPPPPPTINALSPAERARLLRSSKKIARVLGTTPRFLDSEVDDLEGVDDFFVTSPSVYRNSADSTSSSSTTLTSTSNTSTSTSITSISSSHTLHRSQKSLPLAPLQDVWPINKHFRPKLSLDTTLESIPASPLTTPAVSTSQSMSRTIPPRHGSRSMSGESNSLESSPPSPSFMIPSHASARRRKLDRLRRTLGDDVPVCLVFPSSATESDSESGSEPSLSSSSVKTNSEEDLVTPDLSPLSSTSSLVVVDSDTTKPKPNDHKPLPRPHQTSPRKKKIANTRDSLFLTSKPPSSSTKAAKAKAKAPQLTTHRAPVPPPFFPPSLLSMPPGLRITPRPTPTPAHTAPSKIPSTKPTPTPTPTLPSPSQTYEHPPIVHRRSHSGSSSGVGLRVILELEEKDESGWYESDLEEGDSEFDFIKEDEVLGAQCRLGDGSAVLYGAPIGKGMGRGLARSYATCAHLGM